MKEKSRLEIVASETKYRLMEDLDVDGRLTSSNRSGTVAMTQLSIWPVLS